MARILMFFVLLIFILGGCFSYYFSIYVPREICTNLKRIDENDKLKQELWVEVAESLNNKRIIDKLLGYPYPVYVKEVLDAEFINWERYEIPLEHATVTLIRDEAIKDHSDDLDGTQFNKVRLGYGYRFGIDFTFNRDMVRNNKVVVPFEYTSSEVHCEIKK